MSALACLDPLIELGAELERLSEIETTCPDAWADKVTGQISERWDAIAAAVPISIEGALVQARFVRRVICSDEGESFYIKIVDNLIAGLEQLGEECAR
jgi:hypothetical protein